MKILRQILIILFLGLLPALSAEGAIAFRSKSLTVKSSASTTATMTEPAGAAQNDILFMWV
ncbi:MAG: hypothetical protein ACAH59_02505, partial [Pseudobdellovibrionaceae bacterium]